MTWPFVTRRVHELELDALRKELAIVSAERSYWRTRGELLTDAALVRVGAIHQPTMEQRDPRKDIASAASMISSALAIKEIDSSKSPRKVAS